MLEIIQCLMNERRIDVLSISYRNQRVFKTAGCRCVHGYTRECACVCMRVCACVFVYVERE